MCLWMLLKAMRPDECEWAHLQPAKSVADVDENSIKLLLTGSNWSIVVFGLSFLRLITLFLPQSFFMHCCSMKTKSCFQNRDWLSDSCSAIYIISSLSKWEHVMPCAKRIICITQCCIWRCLTLSLWTQVRYSLRHTACVLFLSPPPSPPQSFNENTFKSIVRETLANISEYECRCLEEPKRRVIWLKVCNPVASRSSNWEVKLYFPWLCSLHPKRPFKSAPSIKMDTCFVPGSPLSAVCS